MKIFLTLDLTINERMIDVKFEKIFEYLNRYDEANSIKGFEVKIDRLDEVVRNNIEKLVEYSKLCNKEIIFQGLDIEKDMACHLEFLRFYNNIAESMQKRILVTYSSYVGKNKINSYIKTKSKIQQLLNQLSNLAYNLEIAIENYEEKNRLDIDELAELLFEDKRLSLTYDIGNETLVGKQKYCIPKEIEKRVKNIHIHDSNEGVAHKPFDYGNIDLYMTCSYLKSIGYKGIVTIEIYPDFTEEQTDEEIIKTYIVEAKKLVFIFERS